MVSKLILIAMTLATVETFEPNIIYKETQTIEIKLDGLQQIILGYPLHANIQM